MQRLYCHQDLGHERQRKINASMTANKFGIGQPVRRTEDPRFVMGRGNYVDDINLPRQCYGALVMSQVGHALIKTIDVNEAVRAPGVLCVLTAQDVQTEGLESLSPVMPEDMGGPKGFRTLRPILVGDKVRAVGDRLAFVVAETALQARDAAELVRVDYEVLPAVVTVEDATKTDAPAIWDQCPGNVAFVLAFGDKQKTDSAFAKADHIVALKITNNRITANAIEPRAALAEYHSDDDSFALYSTSQNPHGNRSALAGVFKIPETRLRVISPDVGGGFGMKSGGYPEEALVMWGSRRVGRPVKWVATRSESFLGDTHGRDQIVSAEMAFDRDGKILGLRADSKHAVGSHVFGAAAVTSMFSMKLAPNVYAIPTVHLVGKAILTNTAPLSPYRGAGRPEAAYLTERLIDQAAFELEIDPSELRRRNFIKADMMPHRTPTGCVYDSGDFERVMDACLKLSDHQGYSARRTASKREGRLRGRGLAYFLEEASVFNERMEIRFDPGGTITIVAGTHSHGQGHATTFAQLVSDWLGIDFNSIRYVQGDTEKVPFGRGSYGSRSAMLGGNALKVAADRIVEKAKPMAAHLLEAAVDDIEFRDGRFNILGTDRSISLPDVAKAFYRPAFLPKQFEVGLEASGTWASEPPTYPNGCHICEIEIDPETGAITLDRYVAVDDVGLVLNPLLAEGQIHGGLAQGIGQALMEAIVYDNDGQLVSGSFQDYSMPRAHHFPQFTAEFLPTLAASNPLGIKGAGEAGATGAPPAIMHAILDALRPAGVEHIDMPATPLRVWESLKNRQKKGVP